MNIKYCLKRLIYHIQHQEEEEVSLFQNKGLNNIFLLSGCINLFFLFCILLTSSLTFLLGGVLTNFQVIISLVLTILFVFISASFYFRYYILAGLTLIIIFLSSLGLSTFIAGSFYDLSYDGQWYHQDIILTLADGWNPVFDHLTNSDIPIASILNAYPKMSEINSAAFYKFTGHIEYSKMFNIFLFLTAFELTVALLFTLEIVDKLKALILAFLINFNPVVITETISFYIDGQVYALMISIVAILGILYLTKRNYLLLPLCCVIALIVNIKLTAILFALLFIGIFLAYCWGSSSNHTFAKVFIVSIFAFVSSTILLGFNPYLTNIYWYHNPLYLTFGPGAVNYITVNAPRNFYDKDSMSLLAYSTFAKSEFKKGENNVAELKFPFTFSKDEVSIFTSTDPIEGGFGPLFSGIIIFSLLIFGIGIRHGYKGEIRFIYIVSALILISCLVVSASFYARFIPQLWLLPCLALILGLTINTKSVKVLSLVLYGLILFNISLITFTNFENNYTGTQNMKAELQKIKVESQQRKLLVNFGDFRSNSLRFSEAGINFIPTQDPFPCTNPRRLLPILIPESKVIACELDT